MEQVINYVFLFSITSAAITPGTHPHNVSSPTIIIDPHPRSITANGGKIRANITCRQVMVTLLYGRYGSALCFPNYLFFFFRQSIEVEDQFVDLGFKG